jgi:mRNA interferase RelE/StbE
VYAVTVRQSVRRSLKRLPHAFQERLLRSSFALAAEPRPHGCVKLVGHDNLYRIRVGDYRIVYAIDDAKSSVEITIIAHRRDVYRDL